MAEVTERQVGDLGEVRLDLAVELRQLGPGGCHLDGVDVGAGRIEEVAEAFHGQVEAVAKPALPGIRTEIMSTHVLTDGVRLRLGDRAGTGGSSEQQAAAALQALEHGVLRVVEAEDQWTQAPLQHLPHHLQAFVNAGDPPAAA